MKNFLSKFVLTIVLLGVLSGFFPMHVAHGQGGSFNPPPVPQTQNKAAATQVSKDTPQTICSWRDGFSFSRATTCVLASVGVAWLTMVSKVVWIAGIFLDISLQMTLNMAQLLTDVPIVDIGWRVFRDIANLTFIFLLLYISLNTILGSSTNNAKSLLVKIIIVALLINFSLFITKAIIDMANVATLHFYNLIAYSPTGVPQTLSSVFMEGLNLETLYNYTPGGGVNQGVLNQLGDTALGMQRVFLITVLGSIFLLVTAFIFFAAGVLFVIRGLVLIGLMVVSPLAFIAHILPNMSGMATKWWNTLFKQAFFAPIYMAFAYVLATTITTAPIFPKYQAANFANMIGGTSPDNIGILFTFMFLIGFMMYSLIVAAQMGAYGSKTVMAWGKSAQKWGQGFVGRNTIGRAGQVLDKRFGDTKLGNSAAGRFARSLTTGAMVNAKFGSGKSLKDVQKEKEQRQKDAAAGSREMANTSVINRRVDPNDPAAVQAHNADLARTYSNMSNKELENVKPQQLVSHAQHLSASQLESIDKSDKFTEQEKNQIKNAHFTRARDAVSALEADRDPARRAAAIAAHTSAGRTAADYDRELEEHRRHLRGLSKKQMELMNPEMYDVSATDPAARRRAELLVDTLSQSQFNDLVQSDRVIPAQKNALRQVKYRPIAEGLVQPGQPAPTPAQTAEMQRRIRGMSDKDIESLDGSIRNHPDFIRELSASQYESLSKNMSPADKARADGVRNAPITSGLTRPGQPPPTAAQRAEMQNRVRTMSEKDIDALPDDVKDNPDFIGSLNETQYAAFINKLPAARRAAAETARTAPINSAVAAATAAPTAANLNAVRTAITANRSPGDIARLPQTILTSPAVLPTYTPSILSKMAGELPNQAVADAIRAAIIMERDRLNAMPVGYTPTAEDMRVMDAATWLEGAGLSVF